MNRACISFFCILMFSFNLFCSPYGGREFPQAPEFPPAQWVFSNPISLSKLKGKIVLLDFWTYSCINCIHALVEVKKLEEKWKNELVIIGIHSGKFPNEHNLKSLKSAVLKYNIQHFVVNDPDFRIWELYGIQAWPSFVLIDPLGRIVARKTGEGVFDTFDKLIEKLVLEYDVQKILSQEKLNLTLKPELSKNTYLYFPTKLAISTTGRELYVSNSGANNIFVIHVNTGAILEIIGSNEGFQDGDFQHAKFSNPQGLYYKNANLFVTDTNNHSIRKIDLTNKTVSTLFRSTQNIEARSPQDISFRNNEFFVAMAGNHQIWKLDSKNIFQPYIGSGIEELGDENKKNARLAQPSALTISEDKLYFLDSETSSLRVYDFKEDKVTTLIGKGLFYFGDLDGKKETALMQHPLGLIIQENKLFIADTYNHKIKIYDLNTQTLSTFAGTKNPELVNGELLKASFYEPSGLVFFDNKLYVADTNNHSIRIIDLDTKKVDTLEIFYSEKLALDQLKTQTHKSFQLKDEEISSSLTHLTLQWELDEKYIWRAKNSFIYLQSQNSKVLDISNKPFAFQKEISIPVQLSIGDSKLQISVLLDYCLKENTKFCMTENLRFQKRYKVKKTGSLKSITKFQIPMTKGDSFAQ